MRGSLLWQLRCRNNPFSSQISGQQHIASPLSTVLQFFLSGLPSCWLLMAEPYCVHPFARYRFNPFAGVVCEECSSCFGFTCDDNFSTSLLKHEKNRHTGEGKTPLTSEQRDRVNLKLTRDGRMLVSHVVSLLRDDRHSEAKSYLTALLGEECVFYYCTCCQKRLATGKNPCCPPADLEQRKGHIPRNVGVGFRFRPIIWADFDPADQEVYCDMYQRYVREIENGFSTSTSGH